MMDIDFVKWMWIKAGCIFGYTKWSDTFEQFSFPIYEHKHPIEWWLKDNLFYDVGYPLLLQRAIEGVNHLHINNDDYPVIETDQYQVTVFYSMSRNGVFDFEKHESCDAAKESALRYIYEQESKNQNQ